MILMTTHGNVSEFNSTQGDCDPGLSVIVNQFRFNTHCSQPGESIATFIAELHRLTKLCGFGLSLPELLCDCVVWGIGDPCIQKCLLAEYKLTYDQVLELALANSSAEQNTVHLRKTLQTPPKLGEKNSKGSGGRKIHSSYMLSLWRHKIVLL